MMKKVKKGWCFFITGFGLVVGIISSFYEHNKILGVLICVGIMYLFYFFVYLVLKETRQTARMKSWKRTQKVIMAVLYFLSNILILSVLLKERYIRFWDFGGYWGVAIEISDLIFQQPIQTLQNLYYSINADEYNQLIPCILALPLRVLGKDFPMYALIIYNMFISFTYIAILGCVESLITLIDCNVKPCISALFAAIIMIPVFYLPVLLGYLDAFALLNLSLSYLIVCNFSFAKVEVKKDVLLAVSLLLSMLGRRYFSFAVLGVGIGVILMCIWQFLLASSENKKSFLFNVMKNGIVIIGTMLIPLLVFFRGFLINSSKGTIFAAYSAYQSGGMIHNYQRLVVYYGAIILFIAVIGAMYCLRRKKGLSIGIFLLSSFCISTYLFYKVQSMGNHHYYITIVPIMVFACAGGYAIYRASYGIHIFKCAMGLIAFNFIQSVIYVNPVVNLGSLFTNQRIAPLIRDDIPQIQRMVNDIDELAEEGKTVYILSSSTILNDDLVRKAYMPDKLLAVQNVYVSSHVDLRDGFSGDFLNADVILIADPVQYHLGEESQRVIGLLAEEFIEGRELSSHYSYIKDYALEDNVTVSMYEKNREFTETDCEYLRNMFDMFYSDYPDLFHNRIYRDH